MRRVFASTGLLLIATGLLHLVVGLLLAPKPARAIWDDGVLNAVDPHPERQYWYWFMVSGWLLVLTGQLTRWTERRTGVVPTFLGWHLLGMAAVGAVLMPVSGLWLLVPQAILVLRRARRATPAVEIAGSAARRDARPASTGPTRSAAPGEIG